MKINKDDIKKRIIYRASYRGTKEMDVLISSFVKSIINNLNDEELLELEKFVNLSDEDLIKNECGGETGIRTQERVAPLPVFKTGAFNRSAISP